MPRATVARAPGISSRMPSKNSGVIFTAAPGWSRVSHARIAAATVRNRPNRQAKRGQTHFPPRPCLVYYTQFAYSKGTWLPLGYEHEQNIQTHHENDHATPQASNRRREYYPRTEGGDRVD